MPPYGHLSMTNNYFQDPAFLLIVAICGMYVLYYLSQKMTGGYSKILSFIGKQSFGIMALHFTGFKIGSAILNLFINIDVSSLTPTASNVFIVAFYLLLEFLFPV